MFENKWEQVLLATGNDKSGRRGQALILRGLGRDQIFIFTKSHNK